MTRASHRAPVSGGSAALADDSDAGKETFVCSICGRGDLPPVGDCDPPICAECDAEVNFAAIEEVELTDD